MDYIILNFFALLILILAVTLIVKKDMYFSLFEDIKVIFIIGFITIVIGAFCLSAVTSVQNITSRLTYNLALVLSIISVIKGIFILMFPSMVKNTMSFYKNKKYLLITQLVAAIIFSIYLLILVN